MNIRILLFAGVAFALVSCGKKEAATHEITATRPYTDEDAALVPVNSAAERFGVVPSRPTAGSAVSEGADNPFRWVAPPGWSEVAASSMRAVSFKLGASGQGECYLVALPGEAGGTVANVNRWRKQMGQPELSADEIAALPKMEFFGPGATRVDITGSFAGMGPQGDAKDGFRLLGAIKATDQFTLFVKMTGPTDLVSANVTQFDAFCASLGIKDTPRTAPSAE